ncbi:MAG: tetratricopeptide repeat protein [Candidatus Kapaibacterium sp.]|nr:MAG: tetratricopeptide repeat protein [Candidatus Kapabacteria bacterium]
MSASNWGKTLAERLNDSVGLADALFQYGRVFDFQDKYTETLDFYQQSLAIAEKSAYKLGIANALGNIGNVYFAQSQYQQALEYYLTSLRLNEELGNTQGRIKSLGNIGNSYEAQSQYPQALEYFLKSLKLSEKIGDKQSMARSLNNIGYVYQVQNQYKQALEYHLKSLKLKEELADKVGISRSLENIGGIYRSNKQYPQALEYHLKSLNLMEGLSDKRGIARSWNDIGIDYEELQQYDSALAYLQRSFALAKEIQYPSVLANAQYSISSVLTKQNKHRAALPHALEALKLRVEAGVRKEQSESYALLSAIYATLGNYQAAYDAEKNFHSINDSLFNTSNAKRLTTLQTDYDAQKRAAEEQIRAAEARYKAELAAQEKERQTQLQYAAIAGVVLFVLALALASRRVSLESAWGQRFGRFVSFAAVVMLVEFAILFLDPWLDRFTGGIPLWRMAANVGIAVVVTPVHGVMEGRLRASAHGGDSSRL